MISKESANQLSKQAEAEDVEKEIRNAAAQMKYEVEMLNLTDYQQEQLKENGYNITHTANKMGYIWRITW